MPEHSVLNFGQHIFARFISELVKIGHMGQNIWGDYVAALCLSTEEVGCNGVIKAVECVCGGGGHIILLEGNTTNFNTVLLCSPQYGWFRMSVYVLVQSA